MSDEANQSKMFLVIVRLSRDDGDFKKRIKDVVPSVMQILLALSNNDGQLAFTEPDGSSFGYLLKSKKSVGTIQGSLYNGTSLSTNDSTLVLELTGAVAGAGFSRAWNWIQHRQ